MIKQRKKYNIHDLPNLRAQRDAALEAGNNEEYYFVQLFF